MSLTTASQTRYPYEASEVLPPGETLRETLDALDMSQQKLALRTGLSVKHINQIMQGNSALTPETAIALERATGVPARFWNALEARYRDYKTREEERSALAGESQWLKKMPAAPLRRLGYVTATAKQPGRQLQELLEFFGVSTVEAWNQAWAQPAASFLQSAAFAADVGAVAAWLRLGELEAKEIVCAPYDRNRLKALLPDMRALTVEHPQVFWPQLRTMCASVGIALVVHEEITGARASGATRWISPHKAIVQLSNRGKRNDKFWFAFFHELGHVLLHGKKEVFVENEIGGDGGRKREESEANEFAGNLLIPREYERELDSISTAKDVAALANRLGIAPAIVAGRIQRVRKDYTFGVRAGLFQTFEVARKTE